MQLDRQIVVVITGRNVDPQVAHSNHPFILSGGVIVARNSQLKLADAPDFFGPPTLAEILGVSRDVAYNLCHVEGFPVLRTNTRKKIISKAGLIKWLERNVG